MGLSTSVANIILLIALIGSATVLYSVLSASEEIVRKAENTRTEIKFEKLHTFISIDSVTYNATTEEVTINATNKGSTVIQVDGIDVLLDGQIYTQNITSTTVDGVNVSIWLPEETQSIKVRSSINPSRVKVVTHNGVSAYWEA